MSDILEKLQSSKNELLIAEANDIAALKNLKHNKTGLEMFLNHCIAELKFKTKSGEDATVICTSHTPLISIMSMKRKEDKKKAISFTSKGIVTHDSTSVDTWDLVENKIKTVPLLSWQIMNFMLITEKNIFLLDELLHDILKR